MSNADYVCPECGAIYPDSWKKPIRCPHTHPNKNYNSPPPENKPNPWEVIHTYPLTNEWNPKDARQFLAGWIQSIPENTPAGCDCQTKFMKLKIKWNFDSAEEFFISTIVAHNSVNIELDKPLFTVAQAYGKWRRKGVYETTPPSDLPLIDVVIPFHEGDAYYLRQCVQAILDQKYVKPVLHVVADNNCEWPSLPRSTFIIKYKTSSTKGPYRITNALVAGQHLVSPWIAIQDADDISDPDRLWKQIATCRKYGYEMTSASMRQFVDDGRPDLQMRFDSEPIIESGVRFHHVPGGRCINSLRFVSRSAFESVNGFPNLQCSVDFHLDNVFELLNIPVFWSTEVLASRRLHSNSLTNGPHYNVTTPGRKATNDYVIDSLAKLTANPTYEQAWKLGGLDQAFTLERIR